MSFSLQGNKITLHKYHTDKELSICSLILTNKAQNLNTTGHKYPLNVQHNGGERQQHIARLFTEAKSIYMCDKETSIEFKIKKKILTHTE